MTGTAGAHLLIGRVGGMTAGVTNRSGKDALAKFPEFSLRAPEAAQPEHRLLQALRIRRLQLTPVYEMALGSGDRMRTARQRFRGARQCSGFAHEQHRLPPGGWVRVTGSSVSRNGSVFNISI